MPAIIDAYAASISKPRDAEGTKRDDRPEERDAGIRIRRTFKPRQLEPLLQPGQINRRARQSLALLANSFCFGSLCGLP
jgi:hypothetical protein